ncbi:glycoside hydrolase family 43 protein [Balneolales bacterium ANBcel1]|nr:glycoside hydrolase family 43 protein [Balneolales bacterium ANBcel1]
MMMTTLFISISIILGSQIHNPIVQTMFTADPAPMVYNDTLFVYTTHDEQESSNFFKMYDWQLFSTTDMVNWTAHGTVASLEDFKWSDIDNGAWAPQAIERDGKFYFYCPIHGDGIGVLKADTPYGPFKDPIGERLVESDYIWNDIDPTVFIDDDGQAYLYWGNPDLYYAKLNEDMISVDKSIGENGAVKVEMTTEAFGEREEEDEDYPTQYEEGPWLYERDGTYYMVFAAGGIPEVIAYSTGPTATGPWTYQGLIMDRHPGLAFTNHPGVIEYKGNSYLFYHNQELPGGGGFNRSIAVEQFEYNADGTIPEIVPTREGIVEGVGTLDPFIRVEAETIAWSEGLKVEEDEEIGVYISNINNGNFIKVRDVDFGDGVSSFEAHVASDNSDAAIEIRVGSVDGELLGTCDIASTGGMQSWDVQTCDVSTISGVHDLYFVFTGGEGELFNFDYWRFQR